MQRSPRMILGQTSRSVVEQTLLFTRADSGTLYVEKEKGKLRKTYSTDSLLRSVMPRKKGYTYSVLSSQKTYVFSSNEAYGIHPEYKTLGMNSFLLMPITLGNKTNGVLALQSRKPQYFSMDRIRLLKQYCESIYQEIDLALTYIQLSNRYRQQVLYNALMGHEIKNPLAALSLYDQLIQHALERKKMPGKEILISLSREIQRLSLLINELFPGSLKVFSSPKIEKCDLITVIKRSLLSVQFLYPKHLFRFYYPKNDTQFQGDENKLIQAISNILTNAAKFSPASSRITVRLTKKNDAFIISITDRGKGISKKALPFVQKRFYKSTSSQQDGGKGLGLYIAHTIIAAHKGSISISSVFHKGTTVTITLPIVT